MANNQPAHRTRRDRMSENMDTLRDRIAETSDAARETLQDHPGIAVAVAATVGAVVASVVPTSRREVKALRPVADKARTVFDKAVATAKSSGMQHFAEKGVTSAAISSGVAGFVGAVLKAGNTNNVQQTQAPDVEAPTLPPIQPMSDTQPA
jgi:hypothetical protein